MNPAEEYMTQKLPDKLRVINNTMLEWGRRRQYDKGCQEALVTAVLIVQELNGFKGEKGQLYKNVLNGCQYLEKALEQNDGTKADRQLEFLANQLKFDY